MKKLFDFKPSGRTPVQSAVKYYLAAVMFGLPIIISDAYFNITETKSVYFYIVSTIFIVFSLFKYQSKYTDEQRSALSLRQRLELITLDDAMLIFLFSVFLSSVLSSYQQDVWLGISARYQGFFTILVYVAVYFIVSRNYTSSESFVHFAILGFTVVCVLGVLNCYSIDPLGVYSGINPNYKKLFLSTIGNINFYSSYMCLLLPVVVCGFCQSEKRSTKIIYTLSLVLGSWGMMLTSSESFALGFAGSLLIMPLFFFSNLKSYKKYLLSIVIIFFSAKVFNVILTNVEGANIPLSKLLNLFVVNRYVSTAILILCVAAYFLAARAPKVIGVVKKIYPIVLIAFFGGVVICFFISNTVGLGKLDEIFEITHDWGTERGKIWRYCVKTFISEYSFKEILFGTGPETLQRVTADAALFEGKSLDQAHNEYLQYLMTTGVVGLLSYLGVIGSVIYTVIKRLRHSPFAVALFAALVSYWLQACVNIAQPFTTPIAYIYIAVICGIYRNTKYGLRSSISTGVSRDKDISSITLHR